ncbi:GNAT family N-acetyltransferase [Bacillus litorisediminis]|uniref:GNAT family N-acetyltransferase n=1 Tax=Bacillus litorisediminis TaxID=2922713 RepID=UPI001FAC5DFC|nr:GNAT family N-acetyltransferase [Bacillus litorisediminis]
MIRRAKLEDVTEIVRLSSQLGYPVSVEQGRSRLERLLDNPEHAVFVYETGENKLGGWVHVFGKLLIGLEYAEIGGLVVDQQSRRQGIGAKLMKQCEDWARDYGFSQVRLRSGGQRKEAHQFYKQIGYENIKWSQVFCLNFRNIEY